MSPSVQSCVRLIAVGVFLEGCILSLPKDLVDLGALDTCPRWSPEELTMQAERFDHCSDTATLRCALGTLRSDAGVEVRRTASIARLCFLLADRTTDAIARERYAAEGVRWAEIAASENGAEDGARSYYHAVNLGLAMRDHPALALKNLDRLVALLEKARLLAPDIDQGGPARVLGKIYLTAPAWPQSIGDGEKAEQFLQEAVSRHPDHPQNQVFLAQAIWDNEGEDGSDRVKQHLLKAHELLQQEAWNCTRNRWMKDLEETASDTEISLGVPIMVPASPKTSP